MLTDYLPYNVTTFSGPVIGSLLYTWGGFGLPFYVIGSIALLVATYQIVVLPKVDGAEEEEEKILLDEKIRRKERAALAAEG